MGRIEIKEYENTECVFLSANDTRMLCDIKMILDFWSNHKLQYPLNDFKPKSKSK